MIIQSIYSKQNKLNYLNKIIFHKSNIPKCFQKIKLNYSLLTRIILHEKVHIILSNFTYYIYLLFIHLQIKIFEVIVKYIFPINFLFKKL